jgi:Arabinose efflux permease
MQMLKDERVCSPEKNKSSPLDEILSNIGFGNYQVKAFIILGLILINDGAEALVLSFLSAILEREWGLNSEDNGLIVSGVWLGTLIGILLSGKLGDLYGRRLPLVYASLCLYVFGVLSAYAHDFTELLILRTLYGFFMGFQYPLTITYLAEISPVNVRGKILLLCCILWTVGELYTCFVAYFALDNIYSGNWRSMVFWVCQPSLIGWLGAQAYLVESPRFVIVTQKNVEEGIKILKRMAEENGRGDIIDNNAKIEIEEWSADDHSTDENNIGKVSTLFEPRYKKLTLLLWPIWFSLVIIYYGMLYVLPLILSALSREDSETDSSIGSVVIPVLIEIPSCVLGLSMIDREGLGRKNSMFLSFLISAVACLFALFSDYLIFWTTISRGLIYLALSVVYPFTVELYPTFIRATGLAYANGCGRIGGIVMPWVVMTLYELSPKLPFLGFSILSFAAAFLCYLIPFDTTNKELDFEMNYIV